MSAAGRQMPPVLKRAAERYGVSLEYWDILGQKHEAAPEHVRAILEGLGVPAADEARLEQALEEADWEEWNRVAPATLVLVEEGRAPELRVRVPREFHDATAEIEVRLEEGGELRFAAPLGMRAPVGSARLRGREFLAAAVKFPERLPLGYHRMRVRVEAEGRTLGGETHLIVCPARAFIAPQFENGGKAAGVAVHLAGVRTERNWGCGDTRDLKALVEWASGELRASFVALNPLHLIKNRAPYNTSPYLPNSIFYRNHLYIDVEQVEDFAVSTRAQALWQSEAVQREIEELRASQTVDYERVEALKLRFLKLAFATFLQRHWRRGSERAKALRRYVEQEGELLRLAALFCALDETMRRTKEGVWNWQDWPEEYQDPHSEACRDYAARHWRRVLFYQYLQWILDEQLRGAQEHAKSKGMPIGLYHDLALATDTCGSDLWAHREYFASGCRVGAPPDDFSPTGQDWAFPPPNSLKHQESGYRLFIEAIRKNCRHGGALRIDHVMRFFRLFWIPQGASAKEGTYVRDHWRELLPIVALESVRQKVMVVGEDLGTVEPEIREALSKFGVLSYKLLYFEKRADGMLKIPAEYPRLALVSSTTHDLPTLAGFWKGRDIEARRQAGILPDEESYYRQWRGRQEEKQKILDTLHRLHLLPEGYPRDAAQLAELDGELHHAIIAFLVSTPSMLLVLNQEDITKEEEQQNLPGTTWQHPNWRRKMAYTLEELRTRPLPRNCATMVRHLLQVSGRALR